MRDLYFYIHWPFCQSLCPYCDFNSFIAESIDQKSILECYKHEISWYSMKLFETHKIKTIFFGGGTPSLMKPESVGEIINFIKLNFKHYDDLEITLEANPSSSDYDKFLQFANNEINRFSIGVQSFNDENLKKLGRKHSRNDATSAIKHAISINPNSSFDLMYGIQGQTIENWKEDLFYALSEFDIKHISLYNLAIEKGTEFFTMYKNGTLTLPSYIEIENMCDFTHNFLLERNFNRYEVSNYAKDGYECLHNLGYWTIEDYVGIGAGAHGRYHFNYERFESMNIHNPKKWIESIQINGTGIQKNNKISIENQIYEILLMSMRISKGLDISDINLKLSINIMNYINEKKLQQLINENIIKYDDNKIIPINNGLSFSNYIAKCLLK